MNRLTLRRRLFSVCATATLLAGCSQTNGALPQSYAGHPSSRLAHVRYSILLLPGVGGTSTSANGINNRGWITGWSTLSGSTNPEHEMLWIGKRKYDFGTLGGPSSDSAFPKKGDTDDVPGLSETSRKDPLGEDFCFFGTGYTCRGTDWHDGDLDALPLLGGDNSIAIGNNDRGEIVGVSETKTKDPKCVAPQVLDFEAVIWEPQSHRLRELPAPSGDTVAAATAVNDRGDVVGASGPTCATLTPAVGVHPLLWKDGSAIILHTLGGSMNNVAYMINKRGDIAGQSDPSGDATTHAVLWRDLAISDLGTLPGDTSSVASSINDKDQIVGQSCNASGNCRGFLWQDGTMTDLNALIPRRSRYYVVIANDINDDGVIVGQALDKKTGETLAFVATPHRD